MNKVCIIGGGLAGSEAALFLASKGTKVRLYEMRPKVRTLAHTTHLLAELVCSNSLKSNEITAAHGLLKEEMKILGSKLLGIAEENRVPAGGSLAVDREAFSRSVTETIERNENIEVVREEAKAFPSDALAILAAGPLISARLAESVSSLAGKDSLFFYDAVAPIVDSSTIDSSRSFVSSRYDKGTPDFVNCPMNREEYGRFFQALTQAEEHPIKDFEKNHFFEGCLPVEEIARRGEKSLLFGPLRPVGFIDPKTGKRPFAVVQLRMEDTEGRMMNMVGFQTRLKEKEQRRVFSMIPALRNVMFLRYGKMHRNSYLDGGRTLDSYLRLRASPNVFVAGQLTGSEGYTEAMVTGLISAINVFRISKGLGPQIPPVHTATGSLISYITNSKTGESQPMNFNFGLLPELENRPKGKKERKKMMALRAIRCMQEWVNEEVSQ